MTNQISSVSAGADNSVVAAVQNIRNAKVGVATAGELRMAGASIVNDCGSHALVSELQ